MGVDAAAIAQAPEAIAHVENRINRLRNDCLSFFKEFDEAMDQGLSIQDLLVVNSAQFPALYKHWDANGPAIPTELIDAFNAYKKAREEAQKPAKATQNEENPDNAQENREMDEGHEESTASEGDAELNSAQATPMSQSTAIESEEIASEENPPEIPLESSIDNENIQAQEEENTTEDIEPIKQEETTKAQEVIKAEKEEDNVKLEKEENSGYEEDNAKAEKEVKATKSERKLSDGVDTSGGSSNNTPQRVSSRIRNRLDQAAASSPKTPVVKQLTAEDFDSETDVVPLVNLRKRSAPSPSKAEAKSSESESPPKRISARSRQKATKEQIPPSRTSARNEAKLKKKKNEKNEEESEESEVTPSRRKSTRRTVTRKRKTDDSE